MTRMRYDCANNAHGCYLTNRFDPSVLDGCLPRGSSLINMDAWAEIGNQFLFVEFKRPGELVSTGQQMALRRLGRQPSCTSVLLRETHEGTLNLSNIGTGEILVRNGDMTEVRGWVANWGVCSDTSLRLDRQGTSALPGVQVASER